MDDTARLMRKRYAILFLLALSLWIPFANYGLNGDVIGGDASAMMAYPEQALHRFLGVYLYGPGLGGNGSVGIQNIFPLLLIMTALAKVGIPSAIATRLFISLLFFLTMTGAFFVCRLLVERSASVAWATAAALGGALLYGVNAFTVFAYSSAQSTFTVCYAAAPWILYGTLYGIERNWARGIAIIAGAIVFAGDSTNQAQFAVACSFVVVGLIIGLAEGRKPGRAIGVAIGGMLLGVTCCLWWLVAVPSVVHASLQAVTAHETPIWLSWMSLHSSFAELFKLAGYTGEMSLPYAQWYASPIGTILGFTPLIAVILVAGRIRPRASAVLMLALAAFAALAKGSHAPAGGIYTFLIDHLPGFSIFRSPYDKWVGAEALALACLTAISFAAIGRYAADRHPKVRRLAQGGAIGLAVSIVAFPWTLYTGQALNPGAMNVGFVSIIPKSYARVARAIERSHADGRVVILNSGSWPYALYSWHYFGEDPLMYAVPAPITPLEDIQADTEMLSPRRLAFMLKTFGAQFVIVHHDVMNPVPGPNIRELVGAHDARAMLSTPELSLYRLTLRRDPMVSVIHRPIVVPRLSDDDTLIVGSPVMGMESQFMLTDPARPITLLASAPFPGSGTLRQTRVHRDGRRLLLRVPKTGSTVFVPYNAGASIWHRIPCGAGLSGVFIGSPSAWAADDMDIATEHQARCLDGVPENEAAFDTEAVVADKTQFSAAGVHQLTLNVARKPLTASFGGLTVAHIALAGDAVIVFPAGLRSGDQLRAYALDGNDRTCASATMGASTISSVLPVWSNATYTCGASMLLQLGSSRDRIELAMPAIPLKVPVYVSMQPIPRSRGLLTLRRVLRIAADPGTSNDASGLAPLRLVWSADGSVHSRQPTLLGSNAVVGARGLPHVASATGSLVTSDAYAIDVAYRATGDADATVTLDGSYASGTQELVGDNVPHVLRIALYPAPLSTGVFTIQVRVRTGKVALHARIADAGPNGTFLSLDPGAYFPGVVAAQERVAPWHYRARLHHCTRCIVALQVTDGANWDLRGARVLRRFEGPGGAAGGRILSGGESAWEISAPSGEATITFVYHPAMLVQKALPLSIAGGIVLLLLLLYGRPGAADELPLVELRIGRPVQIVLTGLAGIALLTAIIDGFGWSLGADVFGTAVWLGLVVIACVVATISGVRSLGRSTNAA